MEKSTIGYAQEMPGGVIFEIGNGWIHRRIIAVGGRIVTSSLVNNANGEEYLEEGGSELEITISGEGQIVTFSDRDFKLNGYETPEWSDDIRRLSLDLETEVNGSRLAVKLFYEVRAEDDFLRKWAEIEPCELENWTIREVTLENLKFKELVEGAMPLPRYPRTFDSTEDNVHVDPASVDITNPSRRFLFGDSSRSVVTYWGYNEGLYFFTESLTGAESFTRSKGLVMRHKDWVPLAEGLITGAAVIGAYMGTPEIGFKKYREHLEWHWCAVTGKNTPIEWNTWLVTREGGKPMLSDFNRESITEYIELMREAGFYDVVHLDCGWEDEYPLKADAVKFPNGIDEIAKRAEVIAGADMGYWINPFSSAYWRSKIEDEYPEHLVPGKVSPRSKATAICVHSEFYEYVAERIPELASRHNGRMIYWDGCDWNIPECSSRDHDHGRDPEEIRIRGTKKLADICSDAHDLRQDLIITGFNLPLDNHRLCALDKEQISDSPSHPTIKSELIARQQIYEMAFEHPYRAMSSNWYGVNWHEAGEDNLSRPFAELIHAEMSLIGNGFPQAGASIDLKSAPQKFVDFLKKLAGFRKKFSIYFDTYQHVLGFPNGEQIDGSGHIVDGAGFIVLINPTHEMQSVKLPLDEPALELNKTGKHHLSDWTNLDYGIPLDPAKLDSAPEIELAPLEVRYYGVNLG